MAVFYHVVDGDPLDNGSNSQVIEGLRDCTIEGHDGGFRNQAFIGHRAYCGVCKSAGPIVGGPGTPGYSLRLYDVTIRAHEAVEGDVVVCKCDRSARIIAVYGRSSYIHDMSGSAVSTANASLTNEAMNAHDQQFRLLDTNGKPRSNVRYKIVGDSGATTSGVTDMQGRTIRVTTSAVENLHLYLVS
jgi:hypothetical protein